MTKKLLLLIGATIALGACTQETTGSASGEATVIVVVDGEEVGNEVVEFTEEVTVHDVTDEAYDVEMNGAFLTAIEGNTQSESENIWWVFEVNDEVVNTGAMDTAVEDGDEIVWELTQF